MLKSFKKKMALGAVLVSLAGVAVTAYAVKVGDQGVINVHGVGSQISCEALSWSTSLELVSGDGLCDIWVNTGVCDWVDVCTPPCGSYECHCPAIVVQTHGPCGGYNGGFGLP